MSHGYIHLNGGVDHHFHKGGVIRSQGQKTDQPFIFLFSYYGKTHRQCFYPAEKQVTQ